MMTRTRAALVLLVLGHTVVAAGQQVTVDDLTAPTSPAFVLLDTSPAVVERPENPKAFTLDLINRVSTSKGLPQNYALEVAPYWLASHPQLSFQTYQNPSVGQSVAQSFSVSVATVPMPGATASADPLGTKLGIGFRTNVWNGRPNPALEDRVAALADINGRVLDAIRIETDPTASDAEKMKAAQDEAIARMEARSAALEIQGMDAERIGFFLTFAGGQVWDYRADDVSQAVVAKRGVWVTPAYRMQTCGGNDLTCEGRIDVIGVVRALKDNDQQTRWDLGGRFTWRPLREFYLSLESVRREARAATPEVVASDASNRTVGILEYRIKSDLVLYGSFGRDFQKETGVKPLVSLLGVNFGFGKKPVVLADKPGP